MASLQAGITCFAMRLLVVNNAEVVAQAALPPCPGKTHTADPNDQTPKLTPKRCRCCEQHRMPSASPGLCQPAKPAAHGQRKHNAWQNYASRCSALSAATIQGRPAASDTDCILTVVWTGRRQEGAAAAAGHRLPWLPAEAILQIAICYSLWLSECVIPDIGGEFIGGGRLTDEGPWHDCGRCYQK
jgi:hypothetical protein